MKTIRKFMEEGTNHRRVSTPKNLVLSTALIMLLTVSMAVPALADEPVETQLTSETSITSEMPDGLEASIASETPAGLEASVTSAATEVSGGYEASDAMTVSAQSETGMETGTGDVSETPGAAADASESADGLTDADAEEAVSDSITDILSDDVGETAEKPEDDELSGGLGDGETIQPLVNDIAVSASGTVRTITILNPEAGVTSMQAAIWSDAGGQDDLTWFDMDRQTDGSFSVPVSVGILRHSGSCYVHVYSGSKFINGAIFQVPDAELAVFKLRVEGSGGSRKVILPFTAAGSSFKAALWSDAGGQDDLKWHDMTQQADGDWAVEVPASDFAHSGKCIVHVYSGSKFIDGNTFEITAEELAAFKLTISGSDGKRTVKLPAGYSITGAKAAVWSNEGGQDDLKWYDMSKNADGSWSVEISSDNMLHAGTCIVHVYSGSRFVDGNTFTLAAGEIKTPELSVSGENGKRTLRLTGGSSAYKSLRAAVWSKAGGQDDIKWYDLTKQSDGTWIADISAAYLKHGGECYVHVYCGTAFINGMTFNMTAEEVNSCAFRISGTGGTRLLTVGGAYTGLPSLRAAVWSETGGQDDLKWYNATRQADGTWLVNISVSVLLDGGTVNVHGYSGSTFQFAMTFDLSDAEFDAAVQETTRAYAKNILNATGGTLRGAYNWAVNNISYQSLVIPLTVPTTGKYAGFTRQELYFIYAYEHHLGDCFCYASSVFWCAKELGYAVRLMEGRYISSSQGGPMPHGWVEIDIDGTTYFLDPEWEMQSKMNCYMVLSDPLPLRRDLLAY